MVFSHLEGLEAKNWGTLPSPNKNVPMMTMGLSKRTPPPQKKKRNRERESKREGGEEERGCRGKTIICI